MRKLSVLASVAVFAALSAHAEDGAALFNQSCAMCHQSGATGLPGAFPRLAGRVSVISSKPEGRVYLIDVLTYGLSMPIKVDGQDIMGLMPPFPQLPAESVAAILSYVQTLGTAPPKPPVPFTAEEVTAERGKTGKTSASLPAERQALEKLKVLP